MDHYMTIARGLILVLTLASIFTIFVATLLKMIKSAGFFSGWSRALIAVCMSILIFVIPFDFLVGTSDAYHSAESNNMVKTTEHSRLTIVALGVLTALGFIQGSGLAKTSPDEKSDIVAKGTVSDANKPKSILTKSKPGRPKKTESKNPSVPQKLAGKVKNEVKVNTSAEGTKT